MSNTDLIFEWTVHPIADFPRRRWVFLITVSASILAVWIGFREPFWVFFSLLFLLAALNSFVLPTRYRLTETEIEIHRLIRIKRQSLAEIRRVDADLNGLFLSPMRRPSRLEHYRGLFLPCPRERRSEIEAFLRSRIRSDEHLAASERLQ